jgi:hypothetical protein
VVLNLRVWRRYPWSTVFHTRSNPFPASFPNVETFLSIVYRRGREYKRDSSPSCLLNTFVKITALFFFSLILLHPSGKDTISTSLSHIPLLFPYPVNEPNPATIHDRKCSSAPSSLFLYLSSLFPLPSTPLCSPLGSTIASSRCRNLHFIMSLL